MDKVNQEGGGGYGNYAGAFTLKTDKDKFDRFKQSLEPLRERTRNAISGTAKNIMFVRHGISESNELHKIIEPMQGMTHPFLTDFGRLQAYAFGRDTLSKEEFPKIKFYCSVLPRACETAQLMSQGYIDAMEKKMLENIAEELELDQALLADGEALLSAARESLHLKNASMREVCEEIGLTPISQDDKIQLINGISELPMGLGNYDLKGTQRDITVEELYYMRKVLNKVNKGLKLNEGYVENSPDDGAKAQENNLVNSQSIGGKREHYITTEETYRQFTENIHKIFDEEPCLHVVIVHGKFMMEKIASAPVLALHDPLEQAKSVIALTPNLPVLDGGDSNELSREYAEDFINQVNSLLNKPHVTDHLRSDISISYEEQPFEKKLEVMKNEEIQEIVKNLFMASQFMNKKGKEVTDLFKDKKDLQKDFEEKIKIIEELFKTCYVAAMTGRSEENSVNTIVSKIRTNGKINAFRLKPPNLCAVKMILINTEFIGYFNEKLSDALENRGYPGGGKEHDITRGIYEYIRDMSPAIKKLWNAWLLGHCTEAKYYTPAFTALKYSVKRHTRPANIESFPEPVRELVDSIGKQVNGFYTHKNHDVIEAGKAVLDISEKIESPPSALKYDKARRWTRRTRKNIRKKTRSLTRRAREVGANTLTRLRGRRGGGKRRHRVKKTNRKNKNKTRKTRKKRR